jgi:hypothetical protein
MRVEAVLVIGVFGIAYFVVAWLLGVPTMREISSALRRRRGGSAAGG